MRFPAAGGRLRVYLGVAPGAGATCALLRTPVTLTEQRASRAGSGRNTQVNPKPPPGRREPH